MTRHEVFKISLSPGIPLELNGAAVGTRQPFVATITFAGMPSDGPVGGTEDIPGGPYRILIPAELMESKVEDLIGKGVFAALSLDTHGGTTRVGTFSDAWAQRFPGTDVYAVRASGFFDRAKNEDIVEKVVARARAGELGFSYDMKEAPWEIVEFGGETVAKLLDFQWRGATVLYRQTAAYQYTDLAARLADPSTRSTSGRDDSNNTKLPVLSSTRSTSTSDNNYTEDDVTKEEMQELFASNLKPVTEGQEKLSAKIDKIEGRVATLEGTAAKPKETPPKESKESADITLADFTAGIQAAVAEGMKPVAEKLDALKAETSEGGKRKTFSAEDVATYKRYGGELDDGEDDLTVEGLSNTINRVKANTALSGGQRSAAVNALVNMKFNLQRELRQRAMAGGGVQ